MNLLYAGNQHVRVIQTVSACVVLGLCIWPVRAAEPITPFHDVRPEETKREPIETRVPGKDDDLLSFTPLNANAVKAAYAANTAKPTAKKPDIAVKASRSEARLLPPVVSNAELSLPKDNVNTTALLPSSPERPADVAPANGVSELEYMGLPARMAARKGSAHTIDGPSESELRGIFFSAVEEAIDRSPEISRSKAEQQAALSDIDEAKGGRWPQVNIGSQSQGLKFGKGSNVKSPSGGVNLTVNTMLYDWGRIKNTIGSREKLSLAADESLAAQMEDTSFKVVSTLIELGKQRIISDRSKQFSSRMQDLVNMLAGIVAVDPGRGSELTQAKARLLQAQALNDAAEAKARDAEITLNKLVGDRPVPIPHTAEWNIGLAQMEPLLVAAQNHPTIRQSIAQAEAAELQADAIHAAGLPQLNWGVSKTTSTDALGNDSPWQTNLNITWSAFSGGSNRASENAARQRADASHFETSQQRRDLEFDIRTADNDARTLLERAELYRDLSVESDRIREAFFLQWHHLGKRTLLDVLTAENDHYGNQVNEINNRFDGYLTIVREYASAGILAKWLQGTQ